MLVIVNLSTSIVFDALENLVNAGSVQTMTFVHDAKTKNKNYEEISMKLLVIKVQE